VCSVKKNRQIMVSNTRLDSLHMTHSLPLQGVNSSIVTLNDNFIEGDTFEVVLKRNSLGLGLSVSGGPEAPAPFTNLIRVKKVFPMQPAWESGQFQEGDILIGAGGQALSGLTLRQALDVLRSSPPVTTIFVCRPRAEQFILPEQHQQIKHVQTSSNKRIRSYSFTPASIQHSLSVCDEDQDMDVQTDPDLDDFSNMYKSNNNYGEFIVSLNKINGSLGFSLRSDPEDTTALRHSIKALVKEPAISDGRIRPGDKLISANGYECGAMSHAELISFLRSLPEVVEIKLYRDASRAQTPISTPTESEFSRSHPNLTFLNSASSFSSSSGRPKQLRHEAKEMVRSLQASRNSLDGAGLSGSIGRKLNRPFSPSLARKTGPHPLSNSSSSPLVMKQYSSEEPYSEEPVVETPLSPENENPFQQCFTSSDNNQHRQGLQIEEIIDDTNSSLAMEIENMIEDFECVFKQEVSMDDEILEDPEDPGGSRRSWSPTPPPARPNQLDLFNPEKHNRTSYSFKNPQ